MIYKYYSKSEGRCVHVRTKIYPQMEGLVAILGAFIVPVVAIGGMHRPEGAASGSYRRLDG